MAVSTRIPVRIYYDDESLNWHFYVPDLNIVGGGERTRDEARQAAAEAIAFVLEGDPNQRGSDEGELEYLDVAVG